MSKQYYAVQRTGEKKNELTHWKYIKREKGPNGKWRYYYAEDKNRLELEKVEKVETTVNAFGKKNKEYLIKSPETNNNFEIVSKNTYDSTKDGYRLYVGTKQLSKVTREQIEIGKDFISDLFLSLIKKRQEKLRIN